MTSKIFTIRSRFENFLDAFELPMHAFVLEFRNFYVRPKRKKKENQIKLNFL